MLPADAFLRHIPIVAQPLDRLTCDTFVVSTDIANLAYRRLVETLTEVHEYDGPGISEFLRLKVAADCWTIVDQTHVFLQLLRRMPKSSKITGDFLDEFGFVTKIRNSMDHLTSNLDNISKKKSSSTIYGVINFECFVKSGEYREFITFKLGSEYPEASDNVKMDYAKNPPVSGIGNIIFCAFGHYLNIDVVISKIKNFILELSKTVERSFIKEAHLFCNEYKTEISKIMNDTVYGATLHRLRINPID